MSRAVRANSWRQEHQETAWKTLITTPTAQQNAGTMTIVSTSIFDIAIVDGERGRRLATNQVDSILEVVEWFGRQAPPPTTES
jgi:hypothetical protein